jgi:site-specific DNA-methyltransferase (adenine-specific)
MGSEYDASKMQRQQNCQGVVPFWTQRLIGKVIPTYKAGGRFPANLIHDGSDEVVGLFPETKSGSGDVSDKSRANGDWGMSGGARLIGDSGSAARFFYCAKARKADRDEGCDELPSKQIGFYAQDEWSRQNMNLCTAPVARQNTHPTVKPTALMRYLCRLVTPPNGIVLDPFCGSGSTGKAATLEGFRFVGIEREAEYVEIARARIAAVEGMR